MNKGKWYRKYPGGGIVPIYHDKDGEKWVLFLLGNNGVYGHIWSFPKGSRTDDDCSSLYTAIRETEEETGFSVGNDYQILDPFFADKKCKYWFARMRDMKEPKLSVEHCKWKWLKFSELKKMDVRSTIEYYRTNAAIKRFLRECVKVHA